MFNIKAVYKGEPGYGKGMFYNCYKPGKEYDFYLIDTYKPFEEIELVSNKKKQPSCFFYSFDKLIEDWEITYIDKESMTEHEIKIHPIWNDMKAYIRDRKIKLIIEHE
jgi:hypothetical protein